MNLHPRRSQLRRSSSRLSPKKRVFEQLEQRSLLAVDVGFNALLALEHAPIHYQDTAHDASSGIDLDGKADYITSFDFDGDWRMDNNWENAASYDMPAYGYYSVSETSTHWYIIYAFYHARDWERTCVCADSHENDLEGMLTVVSKPSDPVANPYGQLEAIITVFHHDFYSYKHQANSWGNGRDNFDGIVQYKDNAHTGKSHPVTAQEAHGHGLRVWPDKDIAGGDGVIYYPTLTTAEVPDDPNDRNVQYKLVDMFEPGGLWDHRDDPLTFNSDDKFQGDDGKDDAASPPWKWDDNDDGGELPGGELATDPARLVQIYFSNIDPPGETFDRAYGVNRYIGIDRSGDDYVELSPQYYRPPQVGDGDADFAGHGPLVDVRTILSVWDNSPGVRARISMDAREVGGDGTRASGSTNRDVYEPPEGKRVVEILSATQYPLHDSNLFVPVFSDTDHEPDDFPIGGNGTPVSLYRIVGDTGGDDAGVSTSVTTYFHRAQVTWATDVYPVDSGVVATDSRQGTGYIMYSQENVHDRFSPQFADENAHHFITVQHNGDAWFYDDNVTLLPFTPRATDVLVAGVNYSIDQVRDLAGFDDEVHGIALGYESGDLSFVANQYRWADNVGEFQAFGTYFHRNHEPTELGLTMGGIAAQDSASGVGYLMHSEENVFGRFDFLTNGAVDSSHHLIPVKVVNRQWYYDNNENYRRFTPVDSDTLVAVVDFTNDRVFDLEGTGGSVRGITAGYLNGDLSFQADRYNGGFNNGEFSASGTRFLRNIVDKTPYVDLNLDGAVSRADLVRMVGNFGTPEPGFAEWVDGDVTDDGVVDLYDVTAFARGRAEAVAASPAAPSAQLSHVQSVAVTVDIGVEASVPRERFEESRERRVRQRVSTQAVDRLHATESTGESSTRRLSVGVAEGRRGRMSLRARALRLARGVDLSWADEASTGR